MSDKNSKKITSTNETGYNKWSDFYDSYPNPTVTIDDLTFPKVYEHLVAKNILEIGCGTGRHTLRLLAAENQVTGIDLSEGMLDQLRKKTDHPKLTLLQGDFLSTALPNAPFDAIVSSLVLEHIADLDQYFSIVGKILKPGAKIYLSEIHPERTAAGVFAHFKAPNGDEVHLQSTPHRTSEITRAARSHGFQVLESRTILGFPEFAKLNPKWSKYHGQPMIQFWVIELQN